MAAVFYFSNPLHPYKRILRLKNLPARKIYFLPLPEIFA